MSPDLARARAALLAPVLPLMRDPAAAPTLEELRFAVRRRQQEDLRLAQVYWDELMEWVHARRRGFKKKLTAYRRFITDLVRIHAAEQAAWRIDPATDIFDGLRTQWNTEAMIRETMTLLRDAARRASQQAEAPVEAAPAEAWENEATRRTADPADEADWSAGAQEPEADLASGAANGGAEEDRKAPPCPTREATADDAMGERDRPHVAAASNVEPAAEIGANPLRADRASRPAHQAPPRPAALDPAAMARFTRENPMIPPPPAIFVRNRFASDVPTFDPYAAIQAFKRGRV